MQPSLNREWHEWRRLGWHDCALNNKSCIFLLRYCSISVDISKGYIFMKKIAVFLTIFAGLILAIYVVYPWGSYKYKVTVSIETPEGVKTGSAVREVGVGLEPDILGGGGSASVRGEAVAVDLGTRGVVFAVMGTDDEYLVWNTFPTDKSALTRAGVWHYILLKEGPKQVALKDRPLLVSFKDIRDPKTVEAVYRVYSKVAYSRNPADLAVEDNFEKIFGPDVRLKDITIEMTDEKVMWDIEKWLPWMGTLKGGYLDGQFSGGGPELSNILHSGNFKVGDK